MPTKVFKRLLAGAAKMTGRIKRPVNTFIQPTRLNHIIDHVFLGKDADVARGQIHLFAELELVGLVVLVRNHHLDVLS